MSGRPIALLLVGAGVLLVLAGIVAWFGRLPGDIRVERENVRLYVPIVSMLLVSVALSVVLYLVRRFF